MIFNLSNQAYTNAVNWNNRELQNLANNPDYTPKFTSYKQEMAKLEVRLSKKGREESNG